MPLASAVAEDAAGLVAHVETVTDLRQMEQSWKVLESTGIATPYQTFSWISAWVGELAVSLDIEPLIVALRDRRGRVLTLLPLGIQKKRGLRIARYLGGKHANMNFPLLDRSGAAGLSGAELRKALNIVAERHALDLIHLESQPLSWDGVANPLMALPHQPCSSSAWKTTLLADPDKMIKGLMSSESRKKLRHKERKLSGLGPVTYGEVRDPDEALAVLREFFEQKSERFRVMGLADPFENPAVRHFLERGVTDGLTEGRAPVVLHAMRVGDRIVSIFGGAMHNGRYTGMLTSFDMDPVISKNSPGDLLLLYLLRDMCAKGIRTFDLGTGDSAYKNDYCETEEPLAESVLPFSLRGRAMALALTTTTSLKRQIKKKSPATAELLSNLRKRKRR